MTKMRSKKGLSLGDAYPAVLTIVLVGLVLGIGLFIMVSTQTAISNDLTTVNNETLTTVTETGETVSNAGECGFSNFGVIIATNVTSGATIASGNYTINADTGVVYSTGSAGYNNTNWNISYTYRGSGNVQYCTAMNTSTTGLGNFSTWIAVIVVVIAAAIVLGIVISSFGRERGAI